MLFPRGDNGRIPVFAVTGTNGKSTTVRMLAHILRQTGLSRFSRWPRLCM